MTVKNFLTGVARVVGRDPNTGAGLLYGTANIDSALTQSLQSTEVRGGAGNEVLFVYQHDKKVDVKVTDPTFGPTILALNSGTSVVNAGVSTIATECYTLSSSGSITLTNTPLGNVEVFLPGDLIQTVTPTGANITVSGGANQMVTAIYDYTATADQIVMGSTTPPDVIDLYMIADVLDDTNTKVYDFIVNIPRFLITGNYTLSMAANSVSNQPLEGTALSVASPDCTSGNRYATATWRPASGTTTSVYGIGLYPALTFSVGAGLPQSKQLNLYGLRGGLAGNTNITTSASYHVTSGSTTLAAYFNVGANTGLVTAGSSVAAGWNAIVTACYTDATFGTLTDIVSITATA
jgi:hypothetical protein